MNLSMSIKTKKMELALIDFNFEELKGTLQEVIKKYTGLVVTEENEKEMVKTKSELAKIETLIDDYRKDNKKEMEKPIKEFEGKCKELIGIIKEASTPIREQLETFETKRKTEKTLLVNTWIKEIAKNYNLDEFYINQITIDSKYLNKTQKDIQTQEDIQKRCEVLAINKKNAEAVEKARQDKLDLIQKTIESTNQKYGTDLKISTFLNLESQNISDIPSMIENAGLKIYESKKATETKKFQEDIKKEAQLPNEKVPNFEKSEIKTEKIHNFDLKISNCNTTKAKLLKEFLEKNKIEFKLEVSNVK